MLEVVGKLLKGSTGFLKISNGTVSLWERRGFISKEKVKLTEFDTADANSTELGKNRSPFRRMHQLTIKYQLEGGPGEVVFFSDDILSLEAVKTEIDDEIERRRAAQEQELEKWRRIHENSIHQIRLLLEILDSVFLIVLELHGSVNWNLMDKRRFEVEQIWKEMKENAEFAPIEITVGKLSDSIRQRRADSIKKACYVLIEAIYQRSADVSSQEGEDEKGLRPELYETFLKSYLLLWDLKLSEHLGNELQEDELGELQILLKNLDELVDWGDSEAGFELVNKLPSVKRITPVFEDLKALVHQYLNLMVDQIDHTSPLTGGGPIGQPRSA